MSKDKHYDIGRGKPPLHSRFKKGESGNPKGRPKRKDDEMESLSRLLNEKMVVTVGKCQKKVTRLEAVRMRAISDAINGDMRAAAHVEKLAERLSSRKTAKQVQSGVLVVPERPETPEEIALWESEIARHQAPYRGNAGEQPGPDSEDEGAKLPYPSRAD